MKRNQIEDTAYFVSFCMELYKNAHSLSGAEVLAFFAKHGVMEYLADNYEVLHTQSPSWILAEIEEKIKECSK
ncbi:MAG: DUF3791 domain-containing protein [Muribaculaceae bacterium]|nr:DUF3791 domain-containing protein [Muribaculaceae bacterium]